MTQEAENEILQKAIADLKRTNQLLAAHEKKITDIGKAWGEFARTLQQPSEFRFLVERVHITVGQTGNQLRRPVAYMTPENVLAWDDLSTLLREYGQLTQEKQQLTASVERISGLKIAE